MFKGKSWRRLGGDVLWGGSYEERRGEERNQGCRNGTSIGSRIKARAIIDDAASVVHRTYAMNGQVGTRRPLCCTPPVSG